MECTVDLSDKDSCQPLTLVLRYRNHIFYFHIDGKVSVDGLLNGLGKAGGKSLLALKKRLAAVEERSRPLEPPLSKIHADRVRSQPVRR